MNRDISLVYGYDGVLPASYTRNEKDWTRTMHNYLEFNKALEKAIELRERGLEVEMIVTINATYIAVYYYVPLGADIIIGSTHTAKLAGAF
jgi:hypothetical protein